MIILGFMLNFIIRIISPAIANVIIAMDNDSNMMLWLCIAIAMIGAIYLILEFIIMSIVHNFIFEDLSGMKTKGWANRGVQRCGWKFAVIMLIVTVVTVMLYFCNSLIRVVMWCFLFPYYLISFRYVQLLQRKKDLLMG